MGEILGKNGTEDKCIPGLTGPPLEGDHLKERSRPYQSLGGYSTASYCKERD